MCRRLCPGLLLLLASVAGAMLTGPAFAQEGFVLIGQGPINRSMGSAATAAPLDAMGALYWNPATITGLPRSELEAGAELLYPQTKVSSTVSAGALAPGFPPVTLSGSTNADNGVFPLPALGLVCKPEASDLVYGLGVFAIGGFAVNYPGSTTNPILTAPPPTGLGVGPVYVNLQIFQFAPTVAVQLTDHLSFGIAPTVDMALLQADPGFFLPPDVVGGFPASEAMTHTRLAWGAGFQAGLYYTTCDGWHFGTSIKTPQWFEPFRYFTMDSAGVPHTNRVTIDYPLIASAGVAYTGFEGWVLSADFRYLDFSNTEGFEGAHFAPNGAVTDLGWRSIFALALGVQYQLTDAVSVRAGYDYNMDPVRSQNTALNIGAPTIIQHTVAVGASYRVSECFTFAISYLHSFENSITGPFQTAAGSIPMTSVTSQAAADSLALGFQVRF